MATKTNTTVNGKDYFRIQRVVDGKKKSFYGRSEKEAKAKYDKFKEEQIRQEYENRLRSDLSIFSDRADEFINNALKPSARYAQGTIQRYISAYHTHIEGTTLDRMPVSRIKASDIQRFYNNLDVSMQTLRQVHKFMSAFWSWMVRCEYANDVLSAVELPRKADNSRHDEIVIWTDDEIGTITENLGDFRLRFLIYLMLYSGMRVGECLGLKYSDIKDSAIHVNRQCYMGEIKPPKANSKRVIPMHHVLKDEIKIHRKWHKQEMKDNGYKTDYVFTTSSGQPIDTRNLHRSLSRFYKRIGIEPKHNHAYRSTFCTHLCRCGVPLEVASTLLGHKSILVTAKHYALVEPQSKQDAIEMLHYDSKEIKKR